MEVCDAALAWVIGDGWDVDVDAAIASQSVANCLHAGSQF